MENQTMFYSESRESRLIYGLARELHQCAPRLTPTEGHGARPISALLDQRLVELSPRPGVDGGPAVLAVVLQHTNNTLNNPCQSLTIYCEKFISQNLIFSQTIVNFKLSVCILFSRVGLLCAFNKIKLIYDEILNVVIRFT